MGLFRDVDVVIGCLDNREARWWVNRCCWKVGTPWIDGGIQEINGVVKVFVPPDGACYECTMTENDYRLINLRYSCPLLRQEDLQAGKVPTAPTISSMIGGLQTQEALKLLHDLPVAGRGSVDLQRRGQSVLPDAIPAPRRLHESRDVSPCRWSCRCRAACAHRLRSFSPTACRRRRPGAGDSSRLVLDRDLVVSIDCIPCGTSRPIMKTLTPRGPPADDLPGVPTDRAPRITHTVEAGSELAESRLCDLGIPPYDMVRVESASMECVFLLTGDRSAVMHGADARQ